MMEVLGALQRAVLQAGVLLLIGVAVWKFWISRRAFGQTMREVGVAGWRAGESELNHRIARIAAVVAVALIPIWLLRFVLQVVAFRDPFVPLSEDIVLLLRYTIFGPVWIAQGIALFVIAAVLVRIARGAKPAWVGTSDEFSRRHVGSRVEWGIVALAAAVLAFTLSMSSHGLSIEGNPVFGVAADLLHTVAAGAWLGSLVLILSTRDAEMPEPDAQFAAQLRAFSPVAVASVTVLVAMGVFLGWQYLGTPSAIWETVYGRVLAAKVIVAGAVMLMGLVNWRKGMPAIDSPEVSKAVWRQARWEVSIAGLVLLLTGFLTGAPRPPDAAELDGGVAAEEVGGVSEAGSPDTSGGL